FAFLLAALLLVGCSQPPQLHTLSGPTMGTSWSVKVVGLPTGMTLPQLQQDLALLLDMVNQQMSTYIPDSDLSRFNQAAADSWHTLREDFYTLLAYSRSLARNPGGAYGPSARPLLNLWGFGRDNATLRAPTDEALAAARARIGWQR